MDSFQRYIFTKYVIIHETALSNQMLTIYMRHIDTYSSTHMIQNIDVGLLNIYIYIYIYIYTKSSILNTSKMSFFLLSIAFSITAEPIASTIHTFCNSKSLGL